MNAITEQVKNTSAWRWFNALSTREKTLFSWAIVIVVALILFAYALPSAIEFHNDRVSDYKQSVNDLKWMQAFETTARNRNDSRQETSQGDGVQLAVISQSAETHNIALQRIQPVSDGVTIEITRQSFDDVLQWLFAIQANEGVTISQARMIRVSPSLVDARIVARQ